MIVKIKRGEDFFIEYDKKYYRVKVVLGGEVELFKTNRKQVPDLK